MAGGRSGIISPIPGVLSEFEDVLALDATVVRLHQLLADEYPGSRTNHSPAAAKLHMVMSVVSGKADRVKLFSERVSDAKLWKQVGRWVRNKLLLFDLGYYDFQLFDRIARNGGYFLSRAKVNANFRIIGNNRTHRGHAMDVVGMKLQDALSQVSRQVLDVQVEVEFKRRKYGDRRRKAKRTFRLVAIRNDDTGDYHLYLTNIGAERLPGEDVGETHRLRWQVEVLFKAMKSHGRLHQLPSRKQHVVECLFWASVLATIASQALYRAVRRQVAADRHMPMLRWASIFSQSAADLLRLLIHPGEAGFERVLANMVAEAPDPNRRRRDRALDAVPQAIAA